MKSFLKYLIVSGLGLLVSLSIASAKSHGDGPAKPEKVIIEYRENSTGFRGYHGIHNENDRFYYFKRNFQAVFEKEFPEVELEWGRFPMKTEKGDEVFEITFLSLGEPNGIEAELRMWAIYKDSDGVKYDYGISLARHASSPIRSSSAVERDLNDIYTKCAKTISGKIKKDKYKIKK